MSRTVRISVAIVTAKAAAHDITKTDRATYPGAGRVDDVTGVGSPDGQAWLDHLAAH